MELWIRTQDRMRLVKANRLHIKQESKNFGGDWYIYESQNSLRYGTYNSKERALEVLEEIEEKIMLLNTFEMSGGIDKEKSIQLISVFGEEKLKGLMFPYQMPLE